MSMHRSVRKMHATQRPATSTSAALVFTPSRRSEFALVQNLDASIVITVSTDADCVKGTTLAAGQIMEHTGDKPLYAKAASGTPVLGITEFSDGGMQVRSDEELTVAITNGTPTMILPADDRRIDAIIENDDASIVITVGPSTVTAGDGVTLAASQFVKIPGQMAIYAIAASGTPNVGISIRKR